MESVYGVGDDACVHQFRLVNLTFGTETGNDFRTGVRSGTEAPGDETRYRAKERMMGLATPGSTGHDEVGPATGSEAPVRQDVLLIRIDDWVGALPLNKVDQVLPAVAIHPGRRSAGDVVGHVNVHGTIVPVADTRGVLGLARRSMALTDHLVLAATPGGPVIVPVDEALGVGVVVADDADAAPDGQVNRPRQPLHPVKAEGLHAPVVTLIDPEQVFGHIATRGLEAGRGQ